MVPFLLNPCIAFMILLSPLRKQSSSSSSSNSFYQNLWNSDVSSSSMTASNFNKKNPENSFFLTLHRLHLFFSIPFSFPPLFLLFSSPLIIFEHQKFVICHCCFGAAYNFNNLIFILCVFISYSMSFGYLLCSFFFEIYFEFYCVPV